MHVHERPNFVEQGPKLVILFFLYLIYTTVQRTRKTLRFMLYTTYSTQKYTYILHVKEGEL
jgi:hypothetical protein